MPATTTTTTITSRCINICPEKNTEYHNIQEIWGKKDIKFKNQQIESCIYYVPSNPDAGYKIEGNHNLTQFIFRDRTVQTNDDDNKTKYLEGCLLHEYTLYTHIKQQEPITYRSLCA